MSMFQSQIEKLQPLLSNLKSTCSLSTLLFTPGVILVLGGISVLFFPSLLIPSIGLFLVSLGVSLSIVVYRVLNLVERTKEIISKFDGKVMVQGVRLPSQEEAITELFGLTPRNPKDDILH